MGELGGTGKQPPVAARTLFLFWCHQTQAGRPLAPPAVCPVEVGCHHRRWNGAAGRMPWAYRLSLFLSQRWTLLAFIIAQGSSFSLSQCPIGWDGPRKVKALPPVPESRLRGERAMAYSGPQSIQERTTPKQEPGDLCS